MVKNFGKLSLVRNKKSLDDSHPDKVWAVIANFPNEDFVGPFLRTHSNGENAHAGTVDGAHLCE